MKKMMNGINEINDKMAALLEFDKILGMLAEYAVSYRARKRLKELRPYSSKKEAERHRDETTEARRLYEAIGNPPLAAMGEIDKIMSMFGKGAMLIPEQLTSVAAFLTACRRMKGYLKRGESISPELSSYGVSIDPVEELSEEISRCIRGDQVDDHATPNLKSIRRQIQQAGESIKQRLDSLLHSHPERFMDSYVIQRNGRYALPVKKEYRRMVEGSVIDTSQSGSTLFIEPASIRKMKEELDDLQIEEENEIRRILYTLTGLVEDQAQVLRINIEVMEDLDFLFAKAGLSISMNGRPAALTEERRIVINNGRHPLLDSKSVVPLKFALGKDINAVVITGPNTGGKTVALKTVGLLSLMAQSGLHVPVDDESLFSINSSVLCDIGDGQSIEQNLSTFSSHMMNIIEIVGSIDDRSLVLLDELGSGTDPTEGMGLAVALLERFRDSGALLVATTHYAEIKKFAVKTPGFCNARMTFDLDTLLPRYRLELGIAGESCALHIAEHLGLSKDIIERARSVAYGEGKYVDNRRDNTEYGASLSDEKPSDRAGKNDCNPSAKARYHDTFAVTDDAIHDCGIKDTDEAASSRGAVECRLKIGDGVRIRSTGEIGIVYAPVDSKGMVGVQVKGRKAKIYHKRIRLYALAEDLYPNYPDYDLSIVFDTVENRKARHKMGKRHIEGNIILTDASTDD